MSSEKEKSRKTLIGVLASREDERRHLELVSLFDYLVDNKRWHETLSDFAFVFTGSTFRRILYGTNSNQKPVKDATRDFLLHKCHVIRLPYHEDGGVVFLTYLVVRRRISIVWSFLTPVTSHWLQPENIALLRLCDHWHVNRLLNAHSVEEWFPDQAMADMSRNLQKWPPESILVDSIAATEGTFLIQPEHGNAEKDAWRINIPTKGMKAPRKGSERRLALIAHDHMKERMIEFAIDYERELFERFSKIITTSTTGSRIKDAAPTLGIKIFPYHSGPKGGDIEIATEIMLGLIDVVIFFVDPLHPHPHIDDIRVVFGACMMQPVRMLTNERQAREWMDFTPLKEESSSRHGRHGLKETT